MPDTPPTSAATERLLAEIAERRNDAEFMARLRKQVEQDQPLLDRLGSTLCLREVVVTCGTFADPGVGAANPVLCMRSLPCDNANHKPERTTHGTR